MTLYENGHCKSCAQSFFFSWVVGVFMTYCREALNFVPAFLRGMFPNFLIFAQELDIFFSFTRVLCHLKYDPTLTFKISLRFNIV